MKAIINVEGGGQPFAGGDAVGAHRHAAGVRSAGVRSVTDRDARCQRSRRRDLQTAGRSGRKLKNLQKIPTVYVVAEKSGRNGDAGRGVSEAGGVDAEEFNLKDKGILGNGHFIMLENNRRQVFDAIRGWLEQKIPTRT